MTHEFIEGSEQLKEKNDNYLKTAEMSEEGNYNMIDGIINNVPSQTQTDRNKEAIEKRQEQIIQQEARIAEHVNRRVSVGSPSRKRSTGEVR